MKTSELRPGTLLRFKNGKNSLIGIRENEIAMVMFSTTCGSMVTQVFLVRGTFFRTITYEKDSPFGTNDVGAMGKRHYEVVGDELYEVHRTQSI